MVAGGGIGGAGEGAQVEDAPEERPAVGDVGDEDGSAGFADIPEGPDGAKGFCEGVVFVEGRAEDLRELEVGFGVRWEVRGYLQRRYRGRRDSRGLLSYFVH